MDLCFEKEKGYQTGLTGIGANRHALPWEGEYFQTQNYCR